MAKLTKKQVLHVAKISNLKLTDAEVKKFTPQLSKIVDFVSQLSEVNTDGIEPTTQTTGLTNVYRKDEVDPARMLTKDEALSGTEETYNDLIKVPAILSGRSSK